MYYHDQEPEYPTVVTLPSVEHTAKKRRACDGCGRWIEAGERYTANKWVVDGEFQTAAYHADKSKCIFDDPQMPDDYDIPF